MTTVAVLQHDAPPTVRQWAAFATVWALPDSDETHPERAHVLSDLVTLPEAALKSAVFLLTQDETTYDKAAFVQRALLIKQATECEKPLNRRLV